MPSQLTDDQLIELLPYRARTLRQLTRRVGDVTPILREQMQHKRVVRVLEVGCGFGTVLLQLRQRFGSRLELHGINKRAFDGDWHVMKRCAAVQGLIPAAELACMEPPLLHFTDANHALPFPSDFFDLVYSQVTFFFFDQKARFLEEVNRVLAPGGVARVDVMVHRSDIPSPYCNGFEIWEHGECVPFWSYMKRFEELHRRRAEHRDYLEMYKTPKLDLSLRLVNSVRLNELYRGWWGTKSIFTADPVEGH